MLSNRRCAQEETSAFKGDVQGKILHYKFCGRGLTANPRLQFCGGRGSLASIHELTRTENLRHPRTNLSNSASPSSLSGTSSIGSFDSPLSSSIIPSLFHSRLKTFLFCKSFPPRLPFLLQDLLHGSPGLFTDISEHSRFLLFSFSVFPLFSIGSVR